MYWKMDMSASQELTTSYSNKKACTKPFMGVFSRSTNGVTNGVNGGSYCVVRL
ncbi:Uncharacterised protein [Vibrio cholerae]|nr:Uncharacterised protein [Vibrio cholerae]